MQKEEYLSRQNELFEQWKVARPDYISNNGECPWFCEDGIINYERWEKQIPKILFLLKDEWSGWEPWSDDPDSHYAKHQFGLNILRWRNLIEKLYSSPKDAIQFLPSPDDDMRRQAFEGIAIMEVIKKSEGNTSCPDSKVREYARKDKDFLKEQIELINPHIILCGKTGDAYSDDIYGEEKWDEIVIKERCGCYRHRERLVIDFWHPSSRLGAEYLFNLLSDLLLKGEVFNKFNFGKN